MKQSTHSTQALFFDPNRKIIIFGFGAVGPSVLRLILSNFTITPNNISIVTADTPYRMVAEQLAISIYQELLTPDSYASILGKYLKTGDILINLTINVSSLDLIKYCQANGILYLDTSNEVWRDSAEYLLTAAERRAKILAYREHQQSKTTALIAHGANPGLVSHFAKQALLEIGEENVVIPSTRRQWAELAATTALTTLQISELDSQIAVATKRIEDANTWSSIGLLEEFVEPIEFAGLTIPAELTQKIDNQILQKDVVNRIIGTHNPILLSSWTPYQQFSGYLLSHYEVFSLADLFTIRDNTQLMYCPTIYFVYRPCAAAHTLLHSVRTDKFEPVQTYHLLLGSDIDSGSDNLGVLLVFNKGKNFYWFGSCLENSVAIQWLPETNATLLQVASGVLGGLAWLLANPECGLVEAEDIDFQLVLKIAAPYLGKLQHYKGVFDAQSRFHI